MAGLRAVIRGASARFEFATVSMVAFGFFSYNAIRAVVAMFVASAAGTTAPELTITEQSLLWLLLYESVALLVLAWFLGVRGWTRQRLGIVPDIPKTAMGIVLGVAAYVIVLMVVNLFAISSSWLGTTLRDGVSLAGGARSQIILAISILHPLFEETFVCGYLISALRDKRGTWFAINASVAVRLLYHLYQGPVSILSVLPIGLLFGYFYARTRQLWPVIVAHVLYTLVTVYAVW